MTLFTASPPERTSSIFSGATPPFEPSTSASETASMVTAATTWLATFVTCPAPLYPTRTIVCPIASKSSANAAAAGTFSLGGDLRVYRLGFGAMRLTGRGVLGEPEDREEARRVLRRAVELGVNLIDTADSYGPEVSERLIAEALH